MPGIRRGRMERIDSYLANRTPEQKRADYLRTLPQRIKFNLGRIFARESYESGEFYRHGNGPSDDILQVYREYRMNKNPEYKAKLKARPVASRVAVLLGITFMAISLILSFSKITGLSILENTQLSSSPILIGSFLLGVLFLYLGYR